MAQSHGAGTAQRRRTGSKSSSRTEKRKSSIGAKSETSEVKVASAAKPHWADADITKIAGQNALHTLASKVDDADVTAMKEYLLEQRAEAVKGRRPWPVALTRAIAILETREKTAGTSVPAKPTTVGPLSPEQKRMPVEQSPPPKITTVGALSPEQKRMPVEQSPPPKITTVGKLPQDKGPSGDQSAPPRTTVIRTLPQQEEPRVGPPAPAEATREEPGSQPARQTWDVEGVTSSEGRSRLRGIIKELSSDADLDSLAAAVTDQATKKWGSDRTKWDKSIGLLLKNIENRKDAIAYEAAENLSKKKRNERENVPPVDSPPVSSTRVTPSRDPDESIRSAWNKIVTDRRAIEVNLGATQDWPNMSDEKKAELTNNVDEALKHLAKSGVPVVQSIMRVAAMATASLKCPTPFPLTIEVTDPIRIDVTTALGRAETTSVEISPYKPVSDHTAQTLHEASETMIHELTHWVAFGMYGSVGNPPYLTQDRLANRTQKAADAEENEQRKQMVDAAIKAIENANLTGDLSALSGLESYDVNIRYKELLPHILEFLVRRENNARQDSLDDVLNAGGEGLIEVKRVADQFARDLERYTKKLNEKDAIKHVVSRWREVNERDW